MKIKRNATEVTEKEAKKMLDTAFEMLLSGKHPKGTDKRGHYVSVRFNVTPEFMSKLCEVYEMVPDGLYENKSEFNRSLVAMGCYMWQEIIKRTDESKMPKAVELLEISHKRSLLMRLMATRHLREEYRRMKKECYEQEDMKTLKELEELEKRHLAIMKPKFDDNEEE